MNFTISRTALLTALSICGKAVSNNRVIPALENYLFELSPNLLTIYANDLQTIISSCVECQCTDSYKIQIPPKIIDVLSKIAEQAVIITIEGLDITVKTSSGLNKMKGDKGDDFPLVEQEYLRECIVAAEDLEEVFFRTTFACSIDELRPAMTGVKIELMGDKLRACATDAWIASTFVLPISTGINHSVIVPKKPIEKFLSLSPKGDVKTMLSDSAIRLKTSSFTFTTRLIDERFPDLNSVIPTTGEAAKINRSDFMGAIDRVSVMAHRITQTVKLTILENKINISSCDVNFGTEAKEDIDCEYSGPEITIGFKYTKLLSTLKHFASEDVFFYAIKPNVVCVIREEDGSGKDDLMLLTPVMV